MHMSYKFGITGAHRLAGRGAKTAIGAKHLHVRCTCTLHLSLLYHTAPSGPCQGAPMYRVWCPQLKVSLNRRTPCQKSFPPLARAACTPQEQQPQKHTRRDSIHVTSKFRIRDAHRLACGGGKRSIGAKHLHVHCTCTLHPSSLSHAAPSRPCQGAPMYRVWCP